MATLHNDFAIQGCKLIALEEDYLINGNAVLRETLGVIVRLKMRAEFRTGEFLRGHIRMEDQHASGRSLSGLGTGRI
jgi:hypothetical protein